MAAERVQKALARMGFGSRRKIEALIKNGHIRINGQQAEPGACVNEGDKINIGSQRVIISPAASRIRVLVYNKPEGEICTRNDEKGRPTVFDRLSDPHHGRWICVGRLDINSSGLLLFTNHGELANRLMHPSTEVEREYAVRVNGEVTAEILKQLLTGVELEDGMAKFDRITDAGGQGANHWYHVILHEGRNREIRRIWQSQDIRVSRLIRVRYANVLLPRSLRQKHRLELSLDEIKTLFQQVNLQWVERTVEHSRSIWGENRSSKKVSTDLKHKKTGHNQNHKKRHR